MKFRYHITAADLFCFLEYHVWHSMSCLMAVMIPVLAIVGGIVSFHAQNTKRGVIYLVIGLGFTLAFHIQLLYRSIRQAKMSQSLAGQLAMELKEEGLVILQGEQTAEVAWKDMGKLRKTGSLILLYTDPIHSYLIPKKHLELLDDNNQPLPSNAEDWKKVYEYIEERIG